MKHFVLFIILLFAAPSGVWAYTSLYGTGISQAVQPCPYKLSKYEKSLAKAQSKKDKLEDAIQIEEEIKSELNQQIKDLNKDIEKMFKAPWWASYLKNYTHDLNYGLGTCSKACVASMQDSALNTICNGNPSTLKTEENPSCDDGGENFCDECNGIVGKNRQTYQGQKFCTSKYLTAETSISDCEDTLAELREIEGELEESKGELSEYKSQLKTLTSSMKRAERANRRNEVEGKSEIICVDGSCDDDKVYSWTKNIGLPIIGGLLINDAIKDKNKRDQQLNYPGNLPAAYLGGMFALNGIYGASYSGAGQGSIGCANMYDNGGGVTGNILAAAALAGGLQVPGVQNTSALGYPQSFYQAPHGGGLFNNGIFSSGNTPGYNYLNGSVNAGINVGLPGFNNLGGWGSNANCIVPPCNPGSSPFAFNNGINNGFNTGFGNVFTNGLGLQGNIGASAQFGYPNFLGQNGYNSFGNTGFNSQSYQIQIQQNQAQLAAQQAAQQEANAKLIQLSELSTQMQAIQQQMALIQSSVGGYNLGLNTSLNINGSINSTFGTSTYNNDVIDGSR